MKKVLLKKILILLFLPFWMGCAGKKEIPCEPVSVIPQVNEIKLEKGKFLLGSKTKILFFEKSEERNAIFLKEQITEKTGLILPTEKPNEPKAPSKSILLEKTSNGDLGNEGYLLEVSAKNINIKAHTSAGLFYGIQTLLQLLPQNEAPSEPEDFVWGIPSVEIKDSPRFGWRGFMLDESRHFFGKERVMQLLDMMALQKMNRFHWHLTDEQGWRIEIKKYPKLTEIGAIGSWSEPKGPKQFYTQVDIKEIIQYASERQIMIIPEIDMPGHATAATRAYPEYSGGGKGKRKGFTFNPGKEETYRFLEDILSEVAGLFPGPYLHLGGDEVHFGNQYWNTNPDIQRLKKKHKLKDNKEVEHFFLRKMADYIHSIGKTPFGWDEISGSGITPDKAMIMWWRHDLCNQLDTALSKNFQVVLCPRLPCYFDFVQHDSHTSGRLWKDKKFSNLEQLHQFPAFMENYPENQQDLVLGVQCNVWTKYIKTPKRLQFMTFPRLSAAAEAGWTYQENKEFEDFQNRLKKMLKFYDTKGIYYFNPFNPESTPEPIGPEKPKS